MIKTLKNSIDIEAKDKIENITDWKINITISTDKIEEFFKLLAHFKFSVYEIKNLQLWSRYLIAYCNVNKIFYEIEYVGDIIKELNFPDLDLSIVESAFINVE